MNLSSPPPITQKTTTTYRTTITENYLKISRTYFSITDINKKPYPDG